MEEIWVDIKGYEGFYQVSNQGRVKSLERRVKNNNNDEMRTIKERILKIHIDKKGYYRVDLCKNGNKKQYLVHRLVAIAFIPNPDNLPQIDHIDTNRLNNVWTNLKWCTNKENSNNELTRKHMSESQKGKQLSDNTKKKISKAFKGESHPFYGKHHTEEAKQKMRVSNSIKIVQLDKNYNMIKIWDSAKEVERETGYYNTNVNGCCRGKIKTYKGFIWMYYEDYIKFKGEI